MCEGAIGTNRALEELGGALGCTCFSGHAGLKRGLSSLACCLGISSKVLGARYCVPGFLLGSLPRFPCDSELCVASLARLLHLSGECVGSRLGVLGCFLGSLTRTPCLLDLLFRASQAGSDVLCLRGTNLCNSALSSSQRIPGGLGFPGFALGPRPGFEELLFSSLPLTCCSRFGFLGCALGCDLGFPGSSCFASRRGGIGCCSVSLTFRGFPRRLGGRRSLLRSDTCCFGCLGRVPRRGEPPFSELELALGLGRFGPSEPDFPLCSDACSLCLDCRAAGLGGHLCEPLDLPLRVISAFSDHTLRRLLGIPARDLRRSEGNPRALGLGFRGAASTLGFCGLPLRLLRCCRESLRPCLCLVHGPGALLGQRLGPSPIAKGERELLLGSLPLGVGHSRAPLSGDPRGLFFANPVLGGLGPRHCCTLIFLGPYRCRLHLGQRMTCSLELSLYITVLGDQPPGFRVCPFTCSLCCVGFPAGRFRHLRKALDLHADSLIRTTTGSPQPLLGRGSRISRGLGSSLQLRDSTNELLGAGLGYTERLGSRPCELFCITSTTFRTLLLRPYTTKLEVGVTTSLLGAMASCFGLGHPVHGCPAALDSRSPRCRRFLLQPFALGNGMLSIDPRLSEQRFFSLTLCSRPGGRILVTAHLGGRLRCPGQCDDKGAPLDTAPESDLAAQVDHQPPLVSTATAPLAQRDALNRGCTAIEMRRQTLESTALEIDDESARRAQAVDIIRRPLRADDGDHCLPVALGEPDRGDPVGIILGSGIRRPGLHADHDQRPGESSRTPLSRAAHGNSSSRTFVVHLN